MMKKLIIAVFTLIACAFAHTQNEDKVLGKLMNDLTSIKNEAQKWYNKDGGDRNWLAYEASSNNLELAKELKMLPSSAIGSKLLEHYDHTKNWENRFKNWGGYRNDYAKWCHGEAKKAFYDAFLAWRKLSSSITETKFHLQQIFANSGGSSGYRLVSFTTGSTVDKTIGSELSASIKASIGGPLDAFATANFDAEVASKFTSSFSTSSFVNKKEELRVNLDKPCYIYQVIGEFSSGTGELFTIGGNIEIFDYDIYKN